MQIAYTFTGSYGWILPTCMHMLDYNKRANMIIKNVFLGPGVVVLIQSTEERVNKPFEFVTVT